MPTEMLVWSNFGGEGSQAADFGSGVEHDTGTMTVTATLVQDGNVGPSDVLSGGIDSGEVNTSGNYDGSSSNSALELDNAGGTGSGSSGSGDTNTVTLALDFDTQDAALYQNAAQNVSFWISDLDRASWIDQVRIIAFDVDGNQLPFSAVSFTNVGANLTVNATTGEVTATSGGNVAPTSADGAVQVTIAGPISRLEIDYDNLSTGDQRVEISDITFDTVPVVIPCLTKGTRVRTDRGEVLVENLNVGDLVVTRDHGLQPVRWIGERTVPADARFAPVSFAKGVLGNNKVLSVSPEHRMVLTGAQTEMMFGTAEALVAARALIDGDRVWQSLGGDVTYFHVLFDQHELIYSDGALTESFHPDANALHGVPRAARDELLALFPELDSGAHGYGPTARPVLKATEIALLLH